MKDGSLAIEDPQVDGRTRLASLSPPAPPATPASTLAHSLASRRPRPPDHADSCRGHAVCSTGRLEDLNRFLGGWAAYFRFGNSAARFGKIRRYALMRLALFISKRNRRSREFGWEVVAFQSPDQLGLTALSGIVVDPRPFRDWRGRPNAGGERRR